MPFTDPSSFEIILNTIAFVVIFVFGLAVYFKNPKSHTNILFFLLAIVLDAYIVSTVFALHPIIKTLESNLFWIRMDMFLGSLIAAFLFLLAHTFPKNKINLKTKYLVFTILYTLAMVVISFTPLVFKSVSYPSGSLTPVPHPGSGMIFYFLHIIGYFSLAFIVLIKNYKKSIGQEKVKTLYFLIGIIITFTGMAIVDFLLVLLGDTSFVFMGPSFPVFLMVLVGIAIVKHQFLDIKPIIARAVSYIILLAILAGGYFGLVFFVFNKLLGINLGNNLIITNVVLGIVIALTFQPLRKLTIKLTDRIFYKGGYNEQKILSDLTHAISSSIDFNNLANKLLETIIKELKTSKAGLVLISNNTVTDARSIGYTNANLINDPDLFEFLEKSKDKDSTYFVLGDLDEDQKYFFRQNDIEAIFPIKFEDEYVAVLVLGDKLSGLPYSQDDLNLLDVFASESGIAIANARLYTNLQKALESKNKFIKVVSHQLRTPMATVKWSLEELKNENTKILQEELINNSYQKVVFINEQLDDILIALDIYDDKISINKTKCDLLEIYKRSIEIFENKIKNNNLKIKNNFNKNIQFINADFNKLNKIFEVLIKNAVLYSVNYGEINITIDESILKDKKSVLVTIADNGIGIDSKEKSYIFEPFFRTDRSKLKSPDGLGLGMFIIKTFIKSHGGEIWVESNGINTGTKVCFNLPID